MIFKYGHFKSRLDKYVSTRNRFRRLLNSVRWWECVDTIFFIKFYVIKWKILKWIYHKHTEKAFVCCPETCWCWDVSDYLSKIEQRYYKNKI